MLRVIRGKAYQGGRRVQGEAVRPWVDLPGVGSHPEVSVRGRH